MPTISHTRALAIMALSSFLIILGWFWSQHILNNQEIDASNLLQTGQETLHLTKILEKQGRVEIQTKTANIWQSVSEEGSFQSGDSLRTGRNAKICILLPGNNEIRLNENSHIEFRIIEPPNNKSGANIHIEIRKGEAYHRVIDYPEKKTSYKITSPHILISSNGGSFNTSLPSEDTTKIHSLYKTVTLNKNKLSLSLLEGQETFSNQNNETLNPHDIDEATLQRDWFQFNKRKDSSKNYELGILQSMKAPSLEIISPVDKEITKYQEILIRGKTDPGSYAYINGESTPVRPDGTFEHPLFLVQGKNTIPIRVEKDDGNSSETNVIITHDPTSTIEEDPERVHGYLEEEEEVATKTPETPENFSFVLSSQNSEEGQAKLSWSLQGTKASDGFKLLISQQDNPIYGQSDYSDIFDPNATSYTWTGLNSQTYYFRLCVYQSKDNSCLFYSNTASLQIFTNQ